MAHRWRYLAVCALLFASLAWAAPLQAFWKEKISRNQVKVAEYVAQLKNGADPDALQRPHLRTDQQYQAKQANKEMRRIMDEAEALARQGRHQEIELPAYSNRGLSDERAEDMLGEKPLIGE